ncbi:bifunctional 4-hydroxy-2-oxoglutarate aldolase/2-dehydro-3-deoxy-phosphogluconate aldolase [bacterium]|nr:MAG: bifunctional 4-hydroxy-2-oxoglutarate aldolase/2-dehydro-3-deoxy-phosphogluconate aldolase [bacterium]
MDLKKFRKKPLMGILRGISPSHVAPLMETVISSGLETIEITMNTQNATQLIRQAVRLSGNRIAIGAGTVLNMQSLKASLKSGATFIVMPVLVRDVVKYCVRNKIPVFPGALTPQEIYNAWEEGAAMVKVFPAKFFGPEYFKEVKAPFNDIELLACGGVTPANTRSYFANGASAIAIGASVFKKEWLAAGDFSNIGKEIKKYLRQIP